MTPTMIRTQLHDARSPRLARSPWKDSISTFTGLPSWMTPAQRRAFRILCGRWPAVSQPVRRTPGALAIVECFYPGCLGSKWIAIQPDGSRTDTQPLPDRVRQSLKRHTHPIESQSDS